MADVVDRQAYPQFAALLDAIISEWPKHHKYLARNISERTPDELAFSEGLSKMVAALADETPGGLQSLASDYRFISEQIILPEELHFRRHGEYRLKTFAEAVEQVYSRADYMKRYMNGLLITDVIWINHCRSMEHYSKRFLPMIRENGDLLEIGPGHGLLLALATREKRVGTLTGWDVSEGSLATARHSLAALSPGVAVTFKLRDIFAEDRTDDEGFDAIVFSEVLEHLENPEEAVRVVYRLCRPGGLVWINVPANSPAPDHLYLVRHPDEASDLLRSVGFEIVERANFAMSGTTYERAIADKLTISCVIVAKRPA